MENGSDLRLATRVLRLTVVFMLCIYLLPGSAGAEDVVWNGPGAPGTTRDLRQDPFGWNADALYPDGSSNNTVTVNADVAGYVFGGTGFADDGTPVTVSNNGVTITNGVIQEIVFGGYAASEFGAATASGNGVTITGGWFNNSVYVGYAISDTGAATASGNRVNITGGRFENSVYGGNAYSESNVATASGNSVTITDSVIQMDVYGGVADSDGTNMAGIAKNNTVTISGGTIEGGIYGGFSGVDMGVESGTATDNTVTLSNTPILTASSIRGGFVGDYLGTPAPGMDAFSGNTLNVWNYAGTSTVATVENFEKYNFVLSDSSQPLSATDVMLNNGAGTASRLTGVNFMAGGAAKNPGETFTLITSANNIGGRFGNEGNIAYGLQGVSLLYEFDLSYPGETAVDATIRGVKANPGAKSLSEGWAAAVASIRQGHDFVIANGISAADAALGGATGSGWSGPTVFGALGGGHLRNKTGSHVDVDSVFLTAGLAWRNNGSCGSLLLGAFFDAGYSDYETHNSFSSGRIRGDGDIKSYGGGLMARYDWNSGLYVEATGRVGEVKNDYDSQLSDAFGNRAGYEASSAYYGAHAGVGYVWRPLDKGFVDFSAKYLWSRVNGDSMRVVGDPVRFEAANSHRVRAGARYGYELNPCVTPYVGAAYEYEFDGDARGGAYGYNYGVPTLKGSTGVGEIGVAIRRNALTVDVGVQVHVGKRQGVSGGARAGWTF